MSATTLPRNVRINRARTSYEVRVHPFPPRAGFALTEEGLDQADDYAKALRALRRDGVREVPSELSATPRTLGQAAEDHLVRLATRGGRRGTPYGPEGMKAARRDARPWLGEPVAPFKRKGVTVEAPPAVDDAGVPFASIPLDQLRARPVNAYLERRYAGTQRAAVGEQQMLRAILEHESAEGEPIDAALLKLQPLRRRKRHRRVPELDELQFMLGFVPDHQRAILEVGATVGGRIMELLQAEDGWFDSRAATLTIPAWATKERREKVVPLLPEEVARIRQQQLARSAGTVRGRDGTPLLFPRKGGTPWDPSSFWNKTIVPARRRAAAAWRDERGLPADAPTPFEWVERDQHGRIVVDVDGQPRIGGFAPHDLRRMSATIMRLMGVSPELAAYRLGHKDAGYLMVTTYADVRADRLRAELDQVAAAGGIAARISRAA